MSDHLLTLEAPVDVWLDGQKLALGTQQISLQGISELPAETFKDKAPFGKRVVVEISPSFSDARRLKIAGSTTRELTEGVDSVGLRFYLDADQESHLLKIMESHGKRYNSFMRKCLRIPSTAASRVFPRRALLSLTPWSQPLTPADASPILMEVGNISASGGLFSSESTWAFQIGLKQKVYLRLEPRGQFSKQILVAGKALRILEEINPSNGNPVRHLGIHFDQIASSGKETFSELLLSAYMELEPYFRSSKT